MRMWIVPNPMQLVPAQIVRASEANSLWYMIPTQSGVPRRLSVIHQLAVISHMT